MSLLRKSTIALRLMRHANVKTTAEIYGLDRELTSAHRTTNSEQRGRTNPVREGLSGTNWYFFDFGSGA